MRVVSLLAHGGHLSLSNYLLIGSGAFMVAKRSLAIRKLHYAFIAGIGVGTGQIEGYMLR